MSQRIRGTVIVVACLGLALCCAGPGKAASVGLNPLKVVMGLINIELEVRLGPQVSVHAFFEHALVAGDHPRWVLTVGPRLHAGVELQGGYVGANLLVIGPTAKRTGVNFAAGPECGYRIPIGEPFTLQPRVLTSRPLQDGSADTFGMEVLVGLSLTGPG